MGDKEVEKPQEKKEISVVPKESKMPQPVTSTALADAEKYLDGDPHFGVAVMVTSDGKPSTLMIPDVGAIDKGAPVYITKPIRINGKNLKAFLEHPEKGVKLPEKIKNLIEDTRISCEAFYYSKNGPLLMVFELKFEEGLIATLTGDADIGSLFDVQGAALRVLRCPEKSFDILKKYVAGLEG